MYSYGIKKIIKKDLLKKTTTKKTIEMANIEFEKCGCSTPTIKWTTGKKKRAKKLV